MELRRQPLLLAAAAAMLALQLLQPLQLASASELVKNTHDLPCVLPILFCRFSAGSQWEIAGLFVSRRPARAA